MCTESSLYTGACVLSGYSSCGREVTRHCTIGLFRAHAACKRSSSLSRQCAAGLQRSCARGPPYPNCTARPPRQHEFAVRVVARNPIPTGGALISHKNGTSSFAFAFTTAWFPPHRTNRSWDGKQGVKDGLIVRVVECNDDHQHHPCQNMTHPEWTNAGVARWLSVVSADLSARACQRSRSHMSAKRTCSGQECLLRRVIFKLRPLGRC